MLPVCCVLILWNPATALAQALTPDMMNPAQGGFAPPDKSLLRKTADNGADDDTSKRSARAPSRIGAIPTYGVPPASGAADVGFDSLNRTRKKPKLYPGAPKPKIAGPGNPPAAAPKAKIAAPVSQSVAGTFPGQPQRRRRPVVAPYSRPISHRRSPVASFSSVGKGPEPTRVV